MPSNHIQSNDQKNASKQGKTDVPPSQQKSNVQAQPQQKSDAQAQPQQKPAGQAQQKPAGQAQQKSQVQQNESVQAAKADDVHKEIPEQRADWEGMAPQSTQRTDAANSKQPSASNPPKAKAAGAAQGRDEEDMEDDDEDDDDNSEVEGEGSYSATRDYNQGLQKAMAAGKTEQGAKEAKRAIDGPEGDALRNAEREAKRGPSSR